MKLVDETGRVLDAEIDIESRADGVDLVVHARFGGPGSERGRNVDYFDALEVLLRRLAGLRATIVMGTVDSAVARRLPEAERALELPWPIRLSPASDCQQLRLDITRAQRVVARAPDAKAHGGNNHKRIRLAVELPAGSPSGAGLSGALGAVPSSAAAIGVEYRVAATDPSVAPADVFTFDPAARERGLAGHATVQNALADYLRSRGWTPLSPGPREPDFDLAWVSDRVHVAEVKSLTGANEDRQMRLGLGQVLHYRHQLSLVHGEATAVLAVERQPSGEWVDLCRALGVILVWPGSWGLLGGVASP